MERKTTILHDRQIDQHGQVLFPTQSILELLYEDETGLDGIIVIDQDEREKFNRATQKFRQGTEALAEYRPNETPIDEFDLINTNQWFMPDEYLNLDIEEFVFSKCVTEEEVERVRYELDLYAERDLYPLLRYLVYLVDVMRNNKLVWGVGRGSSCASYVLFLIGVHKINSILYELDIRDFLK